MASLKRYRLTKNHTPAPVDNPKKGGAKPMVLLRNELGSVLRANRLRQRRTLRDVSAAAKVSLGYLSEVERGQKEASSELLASICDALGMPLWVTLREVSDRLGAQDAHWVPDTPEALFEDELASVS
jgi:transcriptional regulator with XRE-family HTH domain